LTPVPFFEGCMNIKQIACGGDHSLVLLTNGTLYGFGKGEVPKGTGLRVKG